MAPFSSSLLPLILSYVLLPFLFYCPDLYRLTAFPELTNVVSYADFGNSKPHFQLWSSNSK